jgi:hypothetical protein
MSENAMSGRNSHVTRGTAVVSTGVIKNRAEIRADPRVYGRYTSTSADTDILCVPSTVHFKSRLAFDQAEL